MTNTFEVCNMDLKPVFEFLEPPKPICRCCFASNRRLVSVANFFTEFMELTQINVMVSDNFPQHICWECEALLKKSFKFRQRVLMAHETLYKLMNKCAPFPINLSDPVLSQYSSTHLSTTLTLAFDGGDSNRYGFQNVLQHKTNQENDIEVNGDGMKEELGSDFDDDDIPLEEFRSNVSKISDDDQTIQNILEDTNNIEVKQEIDVKAKKRTKKKDRVKKKKINKEELKENGVKEAKSLLRKPLEVDPNKIRIVTLDPEEQIKQQEEESKAGLRFPFQCKLCYKGFNFESKLENHMKKHSPSRGPFKCVPCSMHFPTAYSSSVHNLIHTRRYECVACGRRMTDKASILDHYRTQHEGLLTLYTCQFCGKVSNNNKTHRGHIRNHHGGDRPKCAECGKSFVNKDSLAEHMQIHQGIKNYECDECGMRFRTRTQIKDHQRKHSDDKNYYCVECDVRFKSQTSLRKHLQQSVKHKDKSTFKFPCPRCEKRFETSSKLEHHVSVQHLGARPHRCAACPAALSSRAALRKHARAHLRTQRPAPSHVCHTCGKAFRGRSVLVNHVRTHTGEKPFECVDCGRKFTQRTAMKTHVKLVHLKIRKTAKIKPETDIETEKVPVFNPESNPPAYDWSLQCAQAPLPPSNVYFRVTSGS